MKRKITPIPANLLDLRRTAIARLQAEHRRLKTPIDIINARGSKQLPEPTHQPAGFEPKLTNSITADKPFVPDIILPGTLKTVPLPTLMNAMAQPAKPQPQASKPKKRHYLGGLSYLLITIIAVAVGFLSQDLGVGQWLAGAAGLIILVFKINSRYSFFTALFMLVLVPAFTVLGRTNLANNYAVYCYYFLVFGVVSAIRELHKERGKG